MGLKDPVVGDMSIFVISLGKKQHKGCQMRQWVKSIFGHGRYEDLSSGATIQH